MEGGWRPHPDAVEDQPALLPVEPGSVAGVGAICDLGPQRPGDARSQSFAVGEFVALDDGRRVLLHKDRGFTIGIPPREPGADHLRDHETPDSITQNVLIAVLPDDDDSGEDHPWPWLAELAQARGLNVTAEDLRGLRYEVILTDNVTRWLASA